MSEREIAAGHAKKYILSLTNTTASAPKDRCHSQHNDEIKKQVNKHVNTVTQQKLGSHNHVAEITNGDNGSLHIYEIKFKTIEAQRACTGDFRPCAYPH